jgi:hypothetical protein
MLLLLNLEHNTEIFFAFFSEKPKKCFLEENSNIIPVEGYFDLIS